MRFGEGNEEGVGDEGVFITQLPYRLSVVGKDSTQFPTK